MEIQQHEATVNVEYVRLSVCVHTLCFKRHIVIFSKAMKSFIKSRNPYIWMHGETGYIFVYLIKETFDKGAGTAD